MSWRVFGEPSDVSKDNVPATRDEVKHLLLLLLLLYKQRLKTTMNTTTTTTTTTTITVSLTPSQGAESLPRSVPEASRVG